MVWQEHSTEDYRGEGLTEEVTFASSSIQLTSSFKADSPAF